MSYENCCGKCNSKTGGVLIELIRQTKFKTNLNKIVMPQEILSRNFRASFYDTK